MFNCMDCLDFLEPVCGRRTRHDYIRVGDFSWWGPVFTITPKLYRPKRKLNERREVKG